MSVKELFAAHTAGNLSEYDTPTGNVWPVTAPLATIAAGTAHFYEGPYGVKCYVPGYRSPDTNGGYARVSWKIEATGQSVSWTKGNEVWFGAAFYITAADLAAIQVSLPILRADSSNIPDANYQRYGVNIRPTTGLVELRYSHLEQSGGVLNTRDTVVHALSSAAFPADQWVQVVAHAVFDDRDPGSGGVAVNELFVNALKQPAPVGSPANATSHNLLPAATTTVIGHLRIGITGSAKTQTQPLTVYFDNARVSGTPFWPYKPPYDPQAIFNTSIPGGQGTDGNSNAVVDNLDVVLNASNLIVGVGGDVPPVWYAKLTDPTKTVNVNGVNYPFRIPTNFVLSPAGADFPTIILDPNPLTGTGGHGAFTECRIWQATWDGTTLRGTYGGFFHYNSDGLILNPDSSRSVSKPYIGNGAGNGLSYYGGMITAKDVLDGEIRHALRYAYSAQDSAGPGGEGVGWRKPATKTDQPNPALLNDGITVTNAACPVNSRMMMGMILQLDPTLNVSARTAPNQNAAHPASKFVQMVCRALQTYGMMMGDGTSLNRVLGFYAENDLTANWASILALDPIGKGTSSASYGNLLRSQDTAPPNSLRASDGVPWRNPDGSRSFRVVSAPLSYTSWT